LAYQSLCCSARKGWVPREQFAQRKPVLTGFYAAE
jgi:hypothetical protein